jgi:hypothetical protein
MNASIFISAAHPGVARAERTGGEWVVERLLTDYDVRSVVADPHREGVLFAGTQGDGLLYSGDRGRTWEPAGLDGQIVKSIAFSPSAPGRVAAGLKPPMVCTSTDGGETWTEQGGFRDIPGYARWRSPAEPPGTAYVQGLAISPTDPDLIVAGIEFGAVIRSTDGGRTWTAHREDAARDCHALVFHHTDGMAVYEAGGDGPGAVSRDGGETWSQPHAGLDRGYGWGVAADPGDPGTWYIAAAPSPRLAHSDQGIASAFIYRWRDGGPWQKLGGGLPQPLDYMPYALVTDPGAPGHLYAGQRNGDVWFTADYGDSWMQLPFNLERIDHALAVLY